MNEVVKVVKWRDSTQQAPFFQSVHCLLTEELLMEPWIVHLMATNHARSCDQSAKENNFHQNLNIPIQSATVGPAISVYPTTY